MLWLQAHVHMQEELFTTHNLMCTVYIWLFVSQLHNIYILSDRMLSSPIQLSSDTMFVACHCTTGLCTINSKHERHQERVILVCHSCHSGLLPPSTTNPCKTSFSHWFARYAKFKWCWDAGGTRQGCAYDSPAACGNTRLGTMREWACQCNSVVDL